MQQNQYYVYIMCNNANTVLYVGMTNDLIGRVYTHKQKLIKGFTSKYNITKLAYFEILNDVNEIIKKEKQIKAGSRKKKIELIKNMNPTFRDLYDDLTKS